MALNLSTREDFAHPDRDLIYSDCDPHYCSNLLISMINIISGSELLKASLSYAAKFKFSSLSRGWLCCPHFCGFVSSRESASKQLLIDRGNVQENQSDLRTNLVWFFFFFFVINAKNWFYNFGHVWTGDNSYVYSGRCGRLFMYLSRTDEGKKLV